MHYLNNWGKKKPLRSVSTNAVYWGLFAQNIFGMVNTPWGKSLWGCSGKELIRTVWCVVLINAENGKGFPILPHPGFPSCWPSGGWGGGMVHLSPSAWERQLWPSLHTLTGVCFRQGQQQAQCLWSCQLFDHLHRHSSLECSSLPCWKQLNSLLLDYCLWTIPLLLRSETHQQLAVHGWRNCTAGNVGLHLPWQKVKSNIYSPFLGQTL